MRAFRQFLNAIYGEEEVEGEDEHIPDNPFVDGDALLGRLDELKRRGGSDYSSYKAILKVLRNSETFDAYRLINNHKELAYHLPRDFCRAIQAAAKMNHVDVSVLATTVWELLQTPPISELSFARLWLLNLYANGTLPPDRRLVVTPIGTPSALEERQLVFIKARLNDRAFFREQRGRLGQVGEWVKPALLIGASCLPADEYRNWIDIAVRQVADPFANAFGTWLKKGQNLPELLAV
jgi:hypothetical protein